jgi:hypothetical protein
MLVEFSVTWLKPSIIILGFIISNQEHFEANSVAHSANTRNRHHPHRPIANLRGFQKNIYSGVKILNNLPSRLKSLMNEKAKFKEALTRLTEVHTHSTLLMNF